MSNLISVNWLHKHSNDENLIVLDATIAKVTSNNDVTEKEIIPSAIFFDIKHKFSDQSSEFPNTIPSEKQFKTEAQHLGITKQSKIVVYDDLGIYSSPRIWWLFKTFGFDQVFVLNGGLPEWKKQNYTTVSNYRDVIRKGDFKANYQDENVVYIKAIEALTQSKKLAIIDARSAARFNCEVPEPRKGLRSGTISNSLNLPYQNVLTNGLLKPKEDLIKLFSSLTDKQQFVFTCGSGITASILDLAANEAGFTKTAVYDGSWTEYGTLIKT